MHQNHLRLPTHLRMDTNRKDEAVILPIREIELLPPQPLHHVRVHEPLRAGAAGDGLQRRPVVEVPVCGDFDDVARLQFAHGRHPARCGGAGGGDVRFFPGLRVVRREVRLDIVVHEAVIIYYPRGFELGDEFPARAPRGRGVAQRFPAAAEGGEDGDAAVEHFLLLRRGELGRVLVRVAVQAELVAGVADARELGGEGFEGVRGGEEGGGDAVFGVQV